MTYLVFIKGEAVTDIIIPIGSSETINLLDYRRPSSKTFVGERKARSEADAISKMSASTGIPKSSLVAYKLIESEI